MSDDQTFEDPDDLHGPDEADADLLDDDGETPTDACPVCGAEVYAHADRCPECGEYIIPGAPPAPTSPAGGGWRVALLLAAGVALVLLLGPLRCG